jgi:hypothetical protein
MTNEAIDDRAAAGVASFDIAGSRLAKRSSREASRFYPHIRLELGRWDGPRLDRTLRRLSLDIPTIAGRIAAWAELLVGTPTIPESALDALGRHEARVRLQTLDCVTLVYVCLALARARDTESFIAELIDIRYAEVRECGVDNHVDEGNFLDFTCEALMMRGQDVGLVQDVTRSVASDDKLKTFQTVLKRHSREARLDPQECEIRPLYGDQPIVRDFIDATRIEELAEGAFKTGDIVFGSKGSGLSTLVQHCFIVTGTEGGTSFVHGCLNGYFYTPAVHEQIKADPSTFPPHLCGVMRGSQYAGDENVLKVGSGRSLFPYFKGAARVLENCVKENYEGALVLRACERV